MSTTYEKDSSGRCIYPNHVKDDVLTLLDGGAAISAIAEQFNLTLSTIRKWKAVRVKQQALTQATNLSDRAKVKPSSPDQENEIKQLRAQVLRLERREAILKKALSIINPAE